MDQGQQFPEDFLAKHGFSPAEQQAAEKKAEYDEVFADANHEGFHESIGNYHKHLDLYQSTGDEDHLHEALRHGHIAKGFNSAYRSITDKSLMSEDETDGNCTHCGEYLGRKE
jgi:methionyl-tRNA synthetase